MEYHDLLIRVRDDGNILASSDLAGESPGRLNLNLAEINHELQLIDRDQTSEKVIKKVGTTLFSSLFDKNISANFAAITASAAENECGVRLRLIFEKPDLAAIPWEFLYDDRTSTFLANNPMTALSRYIDLPLKRQDIKPASLPLKMLLVISSPKDLPALDSVGEKKLIEEALRDHISSGQVEIDVLTKATIIEIDQRLSEKSYNIFHFIGHGIFENDKGYIALTDENGRKVLLDDQGFANLFLGKRGLGLLILNSCKGAVTSSSQVFSGMAPPLVQKGIPAVIAMRYTLWDSTAKLFADKFYRSLALHQPVDEAVQSTRNLISIEAGLDKRDFATPVLYMRAKDGVIFDLSKKRLMPQPPPLPPAGELPDPDDELPNGSKPIFPHNKLFTGRDDDLKWLASVLLYGSPANAATGAVITGWRGVGKSQLAAEFCYRYGRYLQGVHWVRADRDIDTEIAVCGEAMRIPDWPDKLDDKVNATLKAWHESGLHLVVFDNPERDIVEKGQRPKSGPEVISEWLTRVLPAKFLVTSFEPIWPSYLGLQVKGLDVLDIGQSKDLLHKLAPRLEEESDEDLGKLAKWVDNLPLALDLAGRYLAYNPDMSLHDYLLELEEASGSLHTCLGLEDGPSPTHHESLEATLNTSWKKLDDSENGALAKRIFMMCGYCAPNRPIPKNLLEEAAGTKVSKQMFNEAQRKLDRLGLTVPTQKGRMLHGLLAKFAFWQDLHADKSVFPDLARATVATSAQALKKRLPEEINTLHEHLKAITVSAEKSENLDQEITAALLNNLGLDLQYLGDYQAAKEAHQRALGIKEKFYGRDHFEVAGTLSNLGLDLRYLGDYQAAKEAHQRALGIKEKFYGRDHFEVAGTLSNLGLDLQYLGDYQAAKEAHQRALGIKEKFYGRDHFEVAGTLSNLGLDLQYLGDYQAAKEAHQRALGIKEKFYGRDHFEVAGTLNNLGLDLRYLGDLAEARKCFEQALNIFKIRLGEDHPSTKTVQNNLETLKGQK